jgi:hypothetical protein
MDMTQVEGLGPLVRRLKRENQRLERPQPINLNLSLKIFTNSTTGERLTVGGQAQRQQRLRPSKTQPRQAAIQLRVSAWIDVSNSTRCAAGR